MKESSTTPAVDASVLALEPTRVYKNDGRTRVWSVAAPAGTVMVKRFDRPVWRQRLAALVGLHPGQIEARRTGQMRAAGLPVPPILARGSAGGRRWHAYPYAGKSLLWRLRDGDLANRAARLAAIESLAKLVAAMLEAGWNHRDFKTSNLLIDDAGKVWVIDVGAVAPLVHERNDAVAMLATLDVGARLDKASRADRLRFLRHLAALRPGLGDVKGLARGLGRNVLK